MDIEEKDYEEYVRQIEQIDVILRDPIENLIDITIAGLQKGQGDKNRSIFIPPCILEDQEVKAEPLNTAICCSTLQRVFLHRRRFPQLEGKLDRLAKAWEDTDKKRTVLEHLAEPFLPGPPGKMNFQKYLEVVANSDSGPLDPFTASQVLWVLLNSGEGNVLTPMGFLAFFVVSWALHRKYPKPQGVAAGNSPPTAYVTAKCLAPLLSLAGVCRRRADRFDEIRRIGDQLCELMEHPESARRGRWLPLRLDELSGKLYELAGIAVSREGFQECAESLGKTADGLHAKSDTAKAWAEVVAALARALGVLGEVADTTLAASRRMVRGLLPALVRDLAIADPQKRRRRLRTYGLRLPAPHFRAESGKREIYWQDLATSAGEALAVCRAVFAALDRVSRRCKGFAGITARKLQKDPRLLRRTLRRLFGTAPARGTDSIFAALARANRDVADEIEAQMSGALVWCEEVVLAREIAYASARQLTEFDPAELLSALFVTATAQPKYSSLRITDAVAKAMVGLREDGSWIPGQPFFVYSDLGIWAPTSDIVWMLSSTIVRHPEVRAADEALRVYVNWLERTVRTLTYCGSGDRSEDQRLRVTGWISERNLREDRIDVWATAFAINALLGIRELMEFRLWELCKKRFTVLEPGRRLSQVDAVDLGAVHSHRLHRRLAHMARQSAGDDYKKAEYAIVLHGPPGSSKTAITTALAREMWQSLPMSERLGPRLIRITPADFTRKGEDRLDAEARLIFDILGHVRGVTILFDEIDDLLRTRDGGGEASFFKLVVPAMLNRLQDLRDACPRQEICFVLATNYVDRIEPALMRKGRIDAPLPLVYPDRESRRCILGRHLERLRRKGMSDPRVGWAADFLNGELGEARIAATDYWPWKSFDSLCSECVADLSTLATNSLADGLRDRRARQILEQALSRGKAGIPLGTYDPERQKQIPISAELREEFLQYRLAGVEGVERFLDRLFADVRNGASGDGWRHPDSTKRKLFVRGDAAESLRLRLGEDLLERIQDIAAIRGWERIALEVRE